jgi:soluble lytic murein transglycosylase
MMRSALFAAAFAGTLFGPVDLPAAQRADAAERQDVQLKPTDHSRLPAEVSKLWLVPRKSTGSRPPALADFATAVKLEVESEFAKALPILSSPATQQGPLGHYAEYYKGLAELRLGRADEARQTFRALASRQPIGYVAEATSLREAETDEALGENAAAVEVYERLMKGKPTAPDDVLMRMGRAANAAGNKEKATEAYSRVVYEFPFSDLAVAASAELEHLPIAPVVGGSNRYRLELGRAERFFATKRYPQARAAFEPLRALAEGDDRELINLRLAECDYFLRRPRNARDGVKPYIENASRQGEALFFYAVATRELGDFAEYEKIVRRLADEFTAQTWAEEALNNLATQYLVQSDDEQADRTFRELLEKFPLGHYTERAAWKVGWWAYKHGNYDETVRVFETAASRFGRSDYRPSWLYWAARAHEALKETALADARFALVATDYLNSYYGRLAAERLGSSPQRRLIVDVPTTGTPAAPGDDPAPAVQLPPNEQTVRALLSLDLYDQALDELRYAQKTWGDSPAIQATIGWIHNRRGDLRAGINAIKRAYPQYMAAGGEKLPSQILKVLFPVDYWPLIRRYSAERQLDPYMIAALIAQESTFTADVRSSANAYGLMQLLPSTGRQYARSLHLSKRFSIGMLTRAETNLKMGTAYFADLVKQFGAAHYALATYNAGPNRVARWISERPGVDRDEFIDDIPFPETQNYVKKILGTAEDYRRLYGPGVGSSADDDDDAAPAVLRETRPAEAKKASVTAATSPGAKKKPAAKPKGRSVKKKAPAKKSRKAA